MLTPRALVRNGIVYPLPAPRHPVAHWLNVRTSDLVGLAKRRAGLRAHPSHLRPEVR